MSSNNAEKLIVQVEIRLNELIDQCELIDTEIRKEEIRLKHYQTNGAFKIPTEFRLITLKGVYEAYHESATRTGYFLKTLLSEE